MTRRPRPERAPGHAQEQRPDRPPRGRQVLEREQRLPRPRAEVFAFFADARNLEAITPPWLRFEILTRGPIEMRPGTLIDYRIRLLGLPMRWRSEIERFEPGQGFVDRQLRGPYRFWRHTHEFVDWTDGEGRILGTIVKDHVEYEVPFGPLGWLARRLFVERQLDAIFDHRRRCVGERFRASPGGTGLDAARGPERGPPMPVESG